MVKFPVAWTIQFLLAWWLVLAGTPLAHAQDTQPEHLTPYAFNAYGGRFLPFDIYGVRDIYPYWGLRVGRKMGNFEPELSAGFITALGVNLTDAAASLAFPFELGGIKYRTLVGGDYVYYRGHTNIRELPYTTALGIHFGFSPIIDITNFLAIRADFKMNYGPGQSLVVDCGLEFHF